MKNVLIASIFCLCLFGVSYGQQKGDKPECKPEPPTKCEPTPKEPKPEPMPKEPKDPCDNDRIIALGNAGNKDN
jgi:hypothetical protein